MHCSSWQEEEGGQDPPSPLVAAEAEGRRPHPPCSGSPRPAGPQGSHRRQAGPRVGRSDRSAEAARPEAVHTELRGSSSPSLHGGARPRLGTLGQRRPRPGLPSLQGTFQTRVESVYLPSILCTNRVSRVAATRTKATQHEHHPQPTTLFLSRNERVSHKTISVRNITS